MSRVRIEQVAYLLVASLVILLFYPAFVWLVRSWLSNPYYAHGFLVPLIAGVLAWRQWRFMVEEPRQGGAWLALLLTVVSLGVVIWAMRWQNYFVVALGLVMLLVGILFYLEGWSRLKYWLFPLLFLAFMVPLPFIDYASPWLEAFTAQSATALARLVGISAIQQGGEITLPNTAVTVGAPCSGLRSLVTMVTVGVVWIYVVEGRPTAKALMLLAIVPLVAVSNVLRVAILLVVAQLFGEDIALSYYHDWSSPVLFLIALAMLLILGKVLHCSRVREDLF